VNNMIISLFSYLLFFFLKTAIHFINQRILKSENILTVFNIDNNNTFFLRKPNQHIRMICEGSCDTKDWRNEAENSVLPSQELITLKIYNVLNW